MAPADLGPVAEIEQESASPWTPTLIDGELSHPGSISLVMEDEEGQVCGWCCARFFGSEAELLKIAVRPECRRAGLGAALLQHLEDLLNGHMVETIYLEVRSRNEPALRLYGKQGFRVVGKRPGYYSNPADHALILQKQLLSHET